MENPNMERRSSIPEIDLNDQRQVYAEVFRLTSLRKTAEAEELTAKWLAAHPERKN